MDKHSFIPPYGNYKELLSYRKAVIVYDITFRFLAPPRKWNLNLTNVARASLEEILEDYNDYLLARGLQ